jgi:alkaline phosphatase
LAAEAFKPPRPFVAHSIPKMEEQMNRRARIFLILASLLMVVLAPPALAADRLAKNVILFLGDAAGIPTIHGASVYAYGRPHMLFIQHLPFMALVETSTASQWVTDSAAGMTAIVTGQKTHNGVISQSDTAVRGKKDGEPLKTILEYAEERGLSTGVLTNSPLTDATPAACYAHVNDRSMEGPILQQFLHPRFGDGVDVALGPDREEILKAAEGMGLDFKAALKERGYGYYESLEAVPAGSKRVVALFDPSEFDLDRATHLAVDILSRNPKGFFLMVESDLHTEKIIQGLERAAAFDRLIRSIAAQVDLNETLILFTADHSYDFRIQSGRKDQPLILESEKDLASSKEESIRLKNVRRDDHHTGEDVLLMGEGPGAERIKGMISNTDTFHIMMDAYGWEESPAAHGATLLPQKAQAASAQY